METKKNKKLTKDKKINPLLVILVFIILIVVVAKNGIERTQSYEYSIEKIYQENSSDVDAGVQVLMNHNGFEKLSSENKISEMGKLLTIYEQTRIIANLHFSEDTAMYTFTYNTGSISGALGGVSLKEWNAYMNSLVTN